MSPFILVCLFALISTFATALPMPSLSTVTILKSAVGSTGSIAETIMAKQCRPISDVNVPMKISLIKGKPSCKLVLFSTPCSAEDNIIVEETTLDLNSKAIVNPRYPICSFNLGQKTAPGHIAEVTFSENNAFNSWRTHGWKLNDGSCVNLCDNGDPNEGSWERYFTSVKIEINGKPSSLPVNVYSDSECSTALPKIHSIQNGNDVVKYTRKNPNQIVQSFSFEY